MVKLKMNKTNAYYKDEVENFSLNFLRSMIRDVAPFKLQISVSPTLLFLLTEVLVDLTDGPPPQKKIWPEVKEGTDVSPPADAKAKAKADKEKKKKLSDVRSKFLSLT